MTHICTIQFAVKPDKPYKPPRRVKSTAQFRQMPWCIECAGRLSICRVIKSAQIGIRAHYQCECDECDTRIIYADGAADGELMKVADDPVDLFVK